MFSKGVSQEALVTCSMGNRCVVVDEQGNSYHAYVKGALRLEGLRSTSPIAVGDRVRVLPSTTDGIVIIEERLPRRNYIVRKATNLSKESHMLAVNIDLALLVVTLNYPVTSTTFIDRFLATAEAYNVPVVLLFNKVDLYTTSTEVQQLDKLIDLYEKIGYTTIKMSASQGIGCEQVKALLPHKVVLLAGHSGVGKSTLINTIIEGSNRLTRPINKALSTGRHTTTLAEMIPLGTLPKDGYIIDTPGIKGFGTLEMDATNLGHYFREFFLYSKNCRFNNCQHLNEPGCAVLKAIEKGEIALSRYQSYLSILEDGEEGRKYRPPQ